MAHRKSHFSTETPFLDGFKPKFVPQSSARAFSRQIININGKPVDNTKQNFENLKISLPPEPQTPFAKNSASDAFRQILEAQNRTDDDAIKIYERIKNFKFFGQFLKEKSDDKNMDVFLYICKRFGYEAYPPGTVIMNQGDFSNGKVYIVLSGELLIYVQGIAPPAPPANQPVATVPTPRIAALKLENTTVIEQSPGLEGTPHNSSRIENKPETPNSTFRMKEGRREEKSITFPSSLKTNLVAPEDGAKSHRESVLSIDDGAGHTPKIKGFSFLAKERGEFMRKPTMSESPIFSLKKQIVLDKQSTGNITDSEHGNISDNKESSRHLKKSAFSSDVVEPAPPVSSYGVLVNKIHEGSYFGEKALYKKHKRNATIVASNYIELLTLKQEDFVQVQGEFNKARAIMKQFLRDIFPNVESVQTQNMLETLLYNCEVKTFPYKKIITEEGEPGEEFFVVFEGQCEFSKTVIYDASQKLDFPMSERKPLYGLTRTKKEPIPICNAERGTFIGEEILFNERATYEYTVKAASEKVRVISLKKAKFTFRCPKPITLGLQSLYHTKRNRNLQHFQEKLQRKNGPSPSPCPSIGTLADGAKPVITLYRDQNASIQPQSINPPSSPNYLSSPRKIIDSFRFSPRMEDFANPENQGEIPAACPAIRSYLIPSKTSSPRQKTIEGSNNLPYDGPYERKNSDGDNPIRPSTEGNMFFNPALASPTQRPFTGKVHPKDQSFIKAQGQFTFEKSYLLPAVESHDPAVNARLNSFRESFYARQGIIDNPDCERLFDETQKEKKNREIRERRAMSAAGHFKPGASSDRSSNRVAIPSFIDFIKHKQDSITKRKQKQAKKFSRNSIEISCKTSEPTSIISFGTPQVSPNTSRAFLNQNRKLHERTISEFEKNISNMKIRQKKPARRLGLSEVFKMHGEVKPTRPQTTRSSLTLDMNVHFLSGLK